MDIAVNTATSIDWNWFFSALAQSSAAIIGIFLAFTISKIMSNQNDYKHYKNIIDSVYISNAIYTRRLSKVNFDVINYHEILLFRKGLSNIFKRYHVERIPQLTYQTILIPRYVSKGQLDYIVDAYIREKKGGESLSDKELGAILNMDLENVRLQLDYFNPSEEREKLNNVENDIIAHIINMINHRSNILNNPQHSMLINWLLGLSTILYIGGVLYPLSLLPFIGYNLNKVFTIDSNSFFSSKFISLLVVTVAFISIEIIIFFANKKLKYNNDDIKTLEKAIDMKFYSDKLSKASQDVKSKYF